MVRGKSAKFRTRLVIVFFVALTLIVGVVAQISSEDSEDIEDVRASLVADKIVENEGLSDSTQKFIKDLVKKEKVREEDIEKIEKIDLENPPEKVKLGDSIEGTNVAIYSVNYTKDKELGGENRELFVVTYSSEEFKVPLELKPSSAIEYLSFGEALETTGSNYLKTNTGVRSSAEKGYVMMDYGSITGISTSIEALSGEGRIDVIVYVNGEEIGLRNLIYVEDTGVLKDYDKQSRDVIKFQPGDVISVYVETQGGVAWKDAINLVKVELE